MNNLLDLAKTAAYVLVAMFAVLGVFTLGAAIWHWVFLHLARQFGIG